VSAPLNGHPEGRRRSDEHGLELGSHGAGRSFGVALWPWAAAVDVRGLLLRILGGADPGLLALKAI